MASALKTSYIPQEWVDIFLVSKFGYIFYITQYQKFCYWLNSIYDSYACLNPIISSKMSNRHCYNYVTTQYDTFLISTNYRL